MDKKTIITLLFISISNCKAQEMDTFSKVLKPLSRFDYTKPLFNLNAEQAYNTHRHLRFSVLTGYRESVEPVKMMMAKSDDSEHGTSRIYMINLSIQDLLGMGIKNLNNRVVLEVEDPSKFRYEFQFGSKIDWMRRNAWCFEYLFPTGSLRSTDVIKNELCAHFDLTFGYEDRQVDVLVLHRTSRIDKIKSREIGRQQYYLEGIVNNMSMNGLIHLLDDMGFPPLIDETAYTGRVDLNLNVKPRDKIMNLRKALEKYDLDIKEEKRNIKMFVIKQNDTNESKL